MEQLLSGIPPLLFAWTLLKLGVLSLLLAELLARAGKVLFPARGGTLRAWGIALPAGVALLGAALLGVACTGLLYRPAAPLLLVSMAVAGSRRTGAAPLLAGAAREAWRMGAVRSGLVSLAALPLALLVAVPTLSTDARIYHLGAPWQFLNAHRILLSDIPFPFHFALPVEMAFLVPLGLGDPRLASALVALCLAAMLAVFASRFAESAGGDSAVLGVLLALTLAPVLLFTAGGKNDVAAASFVVAGALLSRSGSWRAGAFLLGLGAAAKYTCAPAVVCWLALFPPPRGRRLACLALFALPVLPWLAKAALATGNPVYPFLSGLFPSLGWGPANSLAYQAYLDSLQDPRTFRFSGLPFSALETVVLASLPAALLAPGALAGRTTRRAALAGLAGVVLSLATAHDPRYALPSLLLLALIGGEWAGTVAGRWRRFAIPAVALACLAGIPFTLNRPDGRLKGLGRGLQEGLDRETTTLGEAMRAVSREGFRRILLSGESSSFGLTARALGGFLSADTPFAWKSAVASRSVAELAKKYRQAGVDGVLFNYVSVEWREAQGATAFPWDGRMLRLHHDFVRSRLSPSWRGERCDFDNGGFLLYRLSSRPLPAAAFIPFLPGTEGATRGALLARAGGDDARAAREYARISSSFPDVLAYRAELATSLARTGDWKRAREAYREPARHDLVFWRMSGYGVTLTQTGALPRARDILRRDLERYPFEHAMLGLALADTCRVLAWRELGSGRSARAKALLEEGELALDSTRDGPLSPRARKKLAQIRGMQGDLSRRSGDRIRAAAFYREALELGVGLPEREGWEKGLEACGK